jgi:DNA-binding MurR/RpiR family transcriptional regulator
MGPLSFLYSEEKCKYIYIYIFKTPRKMGNSPVNQNAVRTPIDVRIGQVYMGLSKAHKRAADYVLNNLFRAATMTIDELADAVGISVATANRFAKALGYDGYPQFRSDLVAGFESTLAPVEKLRHQVQRPACVTEIFAAVLEEDIRNLEATRRSLVSGLCERSVDLILGAERIYIMGFGASAFLAGLMAHGLEPYCQTVQSVAGPAGTSAAARQFVKLTARDLVIAIAFPRYHRDTIALATDLVHRGIPVIALTDSPTSPLAPHADITLYVQTGRHRSANSDAAVLSMIQAMCDSVAHRAKNSVHAASKTTESVLPWLYGNHAPQAQQASYSNPPQRARKPSIKSRADAASKKET